MYIIDGKQVRDFHHKMKSKNESWLVGKFLHDVDMTIQYR